LLQLTKSMALELSHFKIRVNSVSPGYIETEINEIFMKSEEGKKLANRVALKRIGEKDELSGIILYLASNASSWTTGSDFVVDGGHLISQL